MFPYASRQMTFGLLNRQRTPKIRQAQTGFGAQLAARSSQSEEIVMLYAEVAFGRHRGLRLTPYRFKNGKFGVTKRKGDPYIFVDTEQEVAHYLALNYKHRMWNEAEHFGPSLLNPSSIHGW